MIFNRFKIKKGIFTCFYRILIYLIGRAGVKFVYQGSLKREFKNWDIQFCIIARNNHFFTFCSLGVVDAITNMCQRINREKLNMLFKMAWTHSPEARDRTIKQFMETGGMPPENVELVSRYHNLDGTGGFAILETTDAAALADYALDWNGLIEIVITPIMDDETIGGVLGKKFS
jgi:hypothetical protein